MIETVYREQAFVERCFCDAPATGPCACCGRARCSAHVERGLCRRCTQAIGRELRADSSRAWLVGGAIGVVTWLVLLTLIPLASLFVAVPVAVASGLGRRRLGRRRAIRALGPGLAMTTGELPEEPREAVRPDYYLGSANNNPPGGS